MKKKKVTVVFFWGAEEIFLLGGICLFEHIISDRG